MIPNWRGQTEINNQKLYLHTPLPKKINERDKDLKEHGRFFQKTLNKT